MRLYNFIKAHFLHLVRGRPKAPLDIRVYRMQVCLLCPKYDNILEVCLLCGCDIEKKTKMADQQCPDKHPRWLRYFGR